MNVTMFGTAELTDEVVRVAADGSRPATDQVLEALGPQVWLMVAARLSPTPAQIHAVDDVAQQVMLVLAKRISRLEQRTVAGLRAFVAGVVRREVAALYRRRGRDAGAGRRVRSLDSTLGSGTGAAPLWQFLSGSATSPRSAADRAELTARLISELGRLKDDYRQIITLAFCDQLPMRDIAKEMSLSRPAASMLLIRAVRALRRKMGVATQAGQTHGTAN
jgi:RNA polymerase sigma factor (sigma-70 family)